MNLHRRNFLITASAAAAGAAIASPWITASARAQEATLLFGTTNAPGTAMVVRATERLEDPDVMVASCVALVDELISLFR